MKIRWNQLLITLTFLSVSLFVFLLINNPNRTEQSTAVPSTQEANTGITFLNSNASPSETLLITAVGDIMVHESQWLSQQTAESSYDFSNNFNLISPFIQSSDLAFANFESTINLGKPLSSFPVFNSPPEVIKNIKDAGFTHLSTANNHSMDTGYSGIKGTLEVIEENGLTALGTYETGEKETYRIENVKGFRLGVASYTTGYFSGESVTINNIRSNGLEKNINFISLTDPYLAFERIKKDLDQMKEASVDAIILLIHWGTEYENTPNMHQRTLARLLVEDGVDLIIGSHPHMLQEMETIVSSSGDHEGLVLYSLGNFLSNQRKEILGMTGTEEGAIARILMTKTESGQVRIKESTILPTWVYRKDLVPEEKIFTYEIIPLLGTPEITSQSYQVPILPLQEIYRNIRSIFKPSQVFNTYDN